MGGAEVSFARRLVGLVYGLGARIHRSVMERSSPQRGRLGCAVLSVGGLTVGGAGKTPVAARIARGFAARGYRVVLASRGYRGRARAAVTVVSDGTHLQSTVEEAGDEALVLASHAPGVPVLVGPDRRIVGHHAVSVYDAEILVLDDGFQHHRLHKDLNIVCVDGQSGLGNGQVFPAGPLREPSSVLHQADWLCLVDLPEAPEAEDSGLQSLFTEWADGDVMRVRRGPVELRRLGGGEARPLSYLENRPIGLLAGIARPSSLRNTLLGLGARIEAEQLFPDHHAYRETDLAKLAPEVETWVTTEKDAFKILPAWVPKAEVWVLRIEAQVESEGEVFDALEAQLRRLGPPREASATAERDRAASRAL